MKILVLSDHFPPDVIGGYELGCFHVTEALAGRGHTCLVVTSRKEGISESISRNNYKTLRVLENIPIMPPGLARRLRLLYLEWHNYYALKKVIKQFQPDCVYVWKPYDLTVSTLNCLHDTNLLLVFYFFDLWFMRLQKLDFNLALQNFKKFNLLFQLTEKLGLQCWRTQLNLPHLHAQFCSKMVEDQCLKYFETRVISHQRIPFGINVADIVFDHEKKALNSPLRLLFSGRFCKEKGILIALETVKILSQKISVHFTAYGAMSVEDCNRWYRVVEELNLGAIVELHPFQRQSLMYQIYHQHDILLFPSCWNEPYGLVPLEAMAAGTVVVSSGDGGSIDYSIHGVNCLLFDDYSPVNCANQILALTENPDLYFEIRKNAFHYVCQNLNFEQTVDSIEKSLFKITNTLRKNA